MERGHLCFRGFVFFPVIYENEFLLKCFSVFAVWDVFTVGRGDRRKEN